MVDPLDIYSVNFMSRILKIHSWYYPKTHLGIVQYFVRIYKSEQRSNYSWPTHPPLNPNIRDQKNLYAYELDWNNMVFQGVRIFIPLKIRTPHLSETTHPP